MGVRFLSSRAQLLVWAAEPGTEIPAEPRALSFCSSLAFWLLPGSPVAKSVSWSMLRESNELPYLGCNLVLLRAVNNRCCLQAGCLYLQGRYAACTGEPGTAQRLHGFFGSGQFLQFLLKRADMLCLHKQRVRIQIDRACQRSVRDAVAHEQAVHTFLKNQPGVCVQKDASA